MSTRPRARPTSIRTRKQQQAQGEVEDMAMDVDVENEVGSLSSAKTKAVSNGRAITTRKKKSATGRRAKEKTLASVDCICSKGDDGSPMILCSECRIWYHFTCVDITEPQAEEIKVYICPTCTQTTGRRSAMNWEGDHAIEECSDDDDVVVQRRKAVLKSWPKQRLEPEQDTRLVAAIKFEPEESDEVDDSEDEYVDDNGRSSGPKRPQGRQGRVRRLSATTSTSNDSDAGQNRQRVTHNRPNSPSRSPSVPYPTKRKAKNPSIGKGSSPSLPTKRKRSGTVAGSEAGNSAQDDPVRKYCLTKLEEMFKEVYLRYPYVRLKAEEGTPGEGREMNKIVRKGFPELSEQEKGALVEDSKRFARELETCVYEIYAEPDKIGNSHAGPKYKDRFRTLQFNLSKPDRVVIHQRITSGSLSAKEISVMSSTNLADEEMKQSIIQAEKESLEHSILQKQSAPRAKITHKGLQDIEDVTGAGTNIPQEFDIEKERQQEEEDRRERERLARLRTTTTKVIRQRTESVSVPPESPAVPPSSAASLDGQHQEQWGAPPPVPLHAMVSPTDTAVHEQRPSFVNSTSDFVAEPELNLGDFINMDEDQDTTHASMIETTEDTSSAISDQTSMVTSPVEATFPAQSASSATGISPFAQRPEMSQGPSFNLNSLWSEPPAVEPRQAEPMIDDTGKAKATSAQDKPKNVTPGEDSRDDSDNMELESVEANDQDFDMFLADETETVSDPPPPAPATPPSVDSLPQVWVGKVSMPLDSSTPQETTLIARQIGGKPLLPDALPWKTLFPSEAVRIEGRVPVDNAVKYLVQMRLNPTKELYAVAFVPADPQTENDFNAVNNFLISKGRHGLVFPWGIKHREYHPGREMYMIPLLQSHPLPEFVELLDDLKLPVIRTRDYLIGIWIVNKGKLVPPPGQPSQSAPPVQPQVMATLPPQSIPTLSSNGVPPQISPLSILAGLPPTSNPSALATGVASLTREQIQNLLQTLTSTSPPGMSALGPGSQPPFPLQPPALLSNQPWGAPSFPVNFPPSNMPFQHPQPQSYNRESTDRRDSTGHDRDYRLDHDRDYSRGSERGDQPWRGQSRGRRGRGRGDGHYDREARPRDSGWPRRPRNEGHDGPSW